MSESFESLKSEIIAHLKKLEQEENSNELKKAVDYFTNSESLVTCLEKSENGTWIEKAGYGVGTIRVWKGKKYKKVSSSPVKWVRVFDKMDRGAKSSMTRLIHKVQACNSEDELYQFCLSHHALFQDENGVDLPIMDKLRAAIDEKKNGTQNIAKPGKEFVDYVPKTEKEKTTKDENEEVDNHYWIQDSKGNRLTNEQAKKRIVNSLNENDKLAAKLNSLDAADRIAVEKDIRMNQNDIDNLMDKLNPDDRKEMESEINTKIENYLKEEKQKKDKELNISDSDINSLTDIDYLKDLQKKVVKENNRLHSEKKYDEANDMARRNYVISDRIKQLVSEAKKHQNRSDAMKGNDNAKKDNAKPTITFDRNGRLGEKAVNTKLGTDNVKAFNTLSEKFADEKRYMLQLPSEVEIDGEKKLAFTNGQFLVIANEISPDVKTNQTEKREVLYPNVEKVIPKEFKDNSAPKVDINIDQVMKDLPKVDFSKKAFNDDSHKQFMKIGNFWYDAKMVKATYDMLKGDNAEVLESKDTYSNGRFGRLCIKTDKGYSVIVSSSNDYAENYKKQSIYNSDEGSMSANAKAEYESRKKTGLTDTYINNAVEFGYQIDNKGFIHGEDKNITFKGKGDNTEFYYNGIPTGIKNRSSYMYGTKENIQTRIDAVKKQIENNIESYKEGKKNPANKPANYDATFPNMTDKDLTDIYKWWSNPKNIEEAIYKNSYKTKVPGLGSYGNDARKIGIVEDRVMDMLPDIKKEIARRGITIRKSLDGELIFESSLESYVKKSISILKKSLIG